MIGYSRAQMQRAMRRDQERARRMGAPRRFGKSGRLASQVDLAAFMNAVNVEGREVVHDQGYWRDMRRLYPWIDREPSASLSVQPLRNRHGRVSWRKVYT